MEWETSEAGSFSLILPEFEGLNWFFSAAAPGREISLSFLFRNRRMVFSKYNLGKCFFLKDAVYFGNELIYRVGYLSGCKFYRVSICIQTGGINLWDYDADFIIEVVVLELGPEEQRPVNAINVPFRIPTRLTYKKNDKHVLADHSHSRESLVHA